MFSVVVVWAFRADEHVFGEFDIARDLERSRFRMIDPINIAGFVSDQETNHGFLIKFLSPRFLIDMTVDFASPFSDVRDCWLSSCPSFVRRLAIERAGWQAVSNACSHKDSFPP